MSLAQLAASDPGASAFVSAHAGTGKTKLLIDRLVRLMLAGADPARILCLTYTKAAAAEMAIRLQKKLGRWVTLDDVALDADLDALLIAPSVESRRRARELFAQVLDLPGGMRIGTIHAFCQSLLKRFPLEAQISPHFQLVDDSDSRAALEQAREAVLPVADTADLVALAGLVGADGFAGLVKSLEQARERLGRALALSRDGLVAAMRRVAGVVSASEAEILAEAVVWADEGPLASVLRIVASRASDSIRPKGERMLDWLSLPPDLRQEHFQAWVDEFFRSDGERRGLAVFANKKLSGVHPEIVTACEAEQTRIEGVQDQIRALRMIEATTALLGVAAPILGNYAGSKARRGLVDYDDLIGLTGKLLQDAGAAWVLFKLDGGLDHLLLDEVQDTAPAQWEIADRLTGDFFVGEGARPDGALARTMFAVGDRKQSIYSFQGADPEEFDRWRSVYGRRVTQANLAWRRTILDISFRSTAPVLALVDAVFALPDAASGVCDPAAPTLHHTPHRAGHAGRVEFWPAAPRPEPPAHTPWTIPHRNQAQTTAPQTLVTELARWIETQVSGGVMLEGENRTLRPGDVLVLVRRRGQFDRALVRALKARGVPVAGLDRMVLTEQPAVQDLLSLCEALLLPQDDLKLAEMLVSPLGGLTDDSLMSLAASRDGFLWDALRSRAAERPDWQAANGFFAALLARVDYASPFGLLSEALGALGGRARLYARLGPEAAEPVDELLAASLVYAAGHPPSLQGFLHWLKLSGAEVKREAEAAGDTVRIMTVHGSKGLEAPLVILPDTTALPPEDRALHWARDPDTGVELPLWVPNKELRCRAVDELREENAAKRAREYNRLLYVALTRARDRLLICGWETHREQDGTWYTKVRGGLQTLGATETDFTAWPGKALVLESPQTAVVGRPPDRGAEDHPAPPAWAGQAPDWRPTPLPPEPAMPRPLAPSRPDGVELGPVPAARSPLAQLGPREAFGRGIVMHALLQHLPNLAENQRNGAAIAYASRAAHSLDDPGAVARQAMSILQTPALVPLFAPGSRAEQPISGVVGTHIVTGQIDRLAVLPDRVLIADYKTNRAPPADAAAVPILYLRQMAAYRAVLALLYPDRPIECLLIWTEGPLVMPLRNDLLDSHAPGAPRLAANQPDAA